MKQIPIMATEEESNQFLDSPDGRDLISETFRTMLEAARQRVSVPEDSPLGTMVARQEIIISAAVKTLAVIMCLGPERDGAAALLSGELVSELFPNVQLALIHEVNSFMRFAVENAIPSASGQTTH